VLWLRAPGILNALPVSVDLISTQGWKLTWETRAELDAAWNGWAMFDSGEGCGGVLDISPDNADQIAQGVYVFNTRVQPEGDPNWVQVARVQLSANAMKQTAWLRFYAPGALGVQKLRKETSLLGGRWNGYVMGPSYLREGYVIEVIPRTTLGNEATEMTIRPESNGEVWNDVLRIFAPEGRSLLDVLLRVVAVPVNE
jgi:hypothetical protein